MMKALCLPYLNGDFSLWILVLIISIIIYWLYCDEWPSGQLKKYYHQKWNWNRPFVFKEQLLLWLSVNIANTWM